MADEDLPTPEDPFPEFQFPPELEELLASSKQGEVLREFAKEFTAGGIDYAALLHQQSFRKLANAVWALDETRVRAVLLRAVTTSIYIHMAKHMEPDQFEKWRAAS